MTDNGNNGEFVCFTVFNDVHQLYLCIYIWNKSH